jgi:predicted  nucleic acid-binding Zn-ribbon protein
MERQRIELDQVLSRATLMEAELAARSEDLAEMRRRVQRTEAESDAVRSDLRDREGKLSQMRDRIAELESKVADLEDQVLRSYRKIRDDDKCMDKAKRALGVAMTLLDERSAPALATRPTDESQG